MDLFDVSFPDSACFEVKKEEKKLPFTSSVLFLKAFLLLCEHYT